MSIHVDPRALAWRVTSDLLGIMDADGHFQEINHAVFTVLGRMPSEVNGRPFLDFVHPEDAEASKRVYADLRKGKTVLKFENRFRHKNGGYRWLSWNTVPENGFFVFNARDITQEKENAATLKTRDDEARLREQFVGILGHDLRNPIAAIDAALGLLSMEAQTDQAREMIGWGQEAVGRMSRLIDDITDFARARLGEGLAVKKVDDVSLNALVAQVVKEIRLANPDRDIRCHLDLEAVCSCDPDRIVQMLSNLVANAVAHGAADQPIIVSGEIADGLIRLAVENGGAPIPAEALPNLFEPFSRTDSQGAHAGLGLGLYISKQIALGHGGDLRVRSDPNGTAFTFSMPAAGEKRSKIKLEHWA